MFSLFNAPRRYPRVYAPHYDSFTFYEGRERWLESTAAAPREAVLLYSLHWLHLEVHNGGFWQYFFNSTGTSYPEALEGYRAIGMPEVAAIIGKAAAKLGEPYPFEVERRRELVGDPSHRMDFLDLDMEFYDLADTEKFFRKVPKFAPFAEAYADAFEKRVRG